MPSKISVLPVQMADSNNPIGPFVKSRICDIRNTSHAEHFSDHVRHDPVRLIGVKSGARRLLQANEAASGPSVPPKRLRAQRRLSLSWVLAHGFRNESVSNATRNNSTTLVPAGMVRKGAGSEPGADKVLTPTGVARNTKVGTTPSTTPAELLDKVNDAIADRIVEFMTPFNERNESGKIATTNNRRNGSTEAPMNLVPIGMGRDRAGSGAGNDDAEAGPDGLVPEAVVKEKMWEKMFVEKKTGRPRDASAGRWGRRGLGA